MSRLGSYSGQLVLVYKPPPGEDRDVSIANMLVISLQEDVAIEMTFNDVQYRITREYLYSTLHKIGEAILVNKPDNEVVKDNE